MISITIPVRAARGLIRLLGEYQSLLESAIQCNLIPGENEPHEEDRENVERDRRAWQRAEQMVKMLEKRGALLDDFTCSHASAHPKDNR